jgi:hypothetical protein
VCSTCQRYKSEHLHPAGLVVPLPIPQGLWTNIALDFVEALPRVRGKSVILTVVDQFSKYCHFIPLAHPYSVESVAQAFFTDVVRLHGVPQFIVSDRDPVFTSNFWHELMWLVGTKLHMTTAFHPSPMGSLSRPTASSSCTCVVSQVSGRGSGSGGCRGRSTSSTRPSRRRCGILHSVSSVGVINHQSGRMSRGYTGGCRCQDDGGARRVSG